MAMYDRFAEADIMPGLDDCAGQGHSAVEAMEQAGSVHARFFDQPQCFFISPDANG